MTLDNYNDVIAKLGNPDTIAEGLVDLNSQLQKDIDEYKAIKSSNDSLRDTNSRLALRITKGVSDINEPVDEKDPFDNLKEALNTAYSGK